MHRRTLATLDQLEAAKWFVNVGVRDTAAAIVLSSWSEAIAHCSTLEWENLCLEAVNQICERIAERSKQRFREWNTILIEVKSVVIPLVQAKTREVVEKHNLPKVFVDTVRWDVLHVCMEAEYADIFSPTFYASQAYWYTKGHFPCGWYGAFPHGKLIIY